MAWMMEETMPRMPDRAWARTCRGPEESEVTKSPDLMMRKLRSRSDPDDESDNEHDVTMGDVSVRTRLAQKPPSNENGRRRQMMCRCKSDSTYKTRKDDT
jgi:hypothetical protein